ncbi:CoA transferase [Rhodococcus ruber]|uniref:CoA transferase n=1 Tax=Rhodococcus ruber TaxID=1830 RepID=A0ABT4MFY1_9NOCA|nr:CoA transferase [Rhodococcus ruber]MCZ4519899.1 CoA transferase [Rhodococcus ruber]
MRVIEFASVIMAQYAGQQLGDLGADVIKVEPPGGDMTPCSEPIGS